MYRTVELYSRYGDLQERPVDIYHFNFTAPFSTSFLTNPYPIQERGASHTDDLLYLFRFKALDQYFVRGEPENQMKDFYVRLMVDYIKYGRSRLNIARSCRRRDMRRDFCEYLDIQRDYSRSPVQAHVTAKSSYNLAMVQLWKLVDVIVETYDIFSTRFHKVTDKVGDLLGGMGLGNH